MSILEGWEYLIEQAEGLDVDGPRLEVTFEDPDELKYALVAMVIYNSRKNADDASWGYNLGTDGVDTLFISKITLEDEY